MRKENCYTTRYFKRNERLNKIKREKEGQDVDARQVKEVSQRKKKKEKDTTELWNNVLRKRGKSLRS